MYWTCRINSYLSKDSNDSVRIGGGYSLLLWCQQSLLMVVPPAVVLAVLVWTFLKMDDKITALQKRVEELEAAQKNAEESEK